MTKELRLMRDDLKQAVTQSMTNNQVIKNALDSQPGSLG